MSEKLKFEKPALTLDEKIQLLKDRGLIFDDEENAKHDLAHIGYYRLSGYFKYFQEKESDNFKAGSNFQNVIDIYKFDRKLRLLTIDAIEKIEISLKANINDYLSKKNGVFWFLDVNHYYLGYKKNLEIFGKLILKIGSKKQESESEIISSFFEKYDEDFLPSWMLFEEFTFGELSNIYKILQKKDKEVIASNYNLDFKNLQTYIVFLNKLRNVAAHHSRLWNKNLNVRLKITDEIFGDRFKKQPGKDGRIEVVSNFYNSALIINYLLKNINKNFGWLDDLDKLFHDFPGMKEKMGFNEEWKKEFEA